MTKLSGVGNCVGARGRFAGAASKPRRACARRKPNPTRLPVSADRPASVSAFRLAALAAWLGAAALLAGVGFIVVRGCDYAIGPLAGYLWYFALHVYLPGVVA